MTREDYVTSPWGRGTCRVCDRPFNLLKNGRIRHHGNPDTFPPRPCAGAGDWPKEA